MVGHTSIVRVQEWMGHSDLHRTLRHLHYTPRAGRRRTRRPCVRPVIRPHARQVMHLASTSTAVAKLRRSRRARGGTRREPGGLLGVGSSRVRFLLRGFYRARRIRGLGQPSRPPTARCSVRSPRTSWPLAQAVTGLLPLARLGGAVASSRDARTASVLDAEGIEQYLDLRYLALAARD